MPGSFQSGIGLISGWVCAAQTITLRFDGGPPQEAAYGTSRGDTQAACGDTDNGFGLLYNWNLLGDGPHTVTAYADGVEFAEVTVTVTTLGAEFRRGLSQEVIVPDFPEVGTDAVLQWQEAQQNFVISFAASTQRLVDVTPLLTLPTGVSLPNVAISSLHSETTAAVRASPEPSLLLAEDTGGTVLLALANLEGGLLGEPTGEVDVSIDSTAVVLVALAAGVRLPDVDQALVDSIFAHPQWPALIAELRGLFQADPNFLDQLLNHPAVVARIRTIGTTLSGTTSADVPPHLAAPPTFADQGGSVLPEGERHAAFNRFSPWAAHAPWVWYGEAHPVLLTPPFLAASEAEPGLTAAGNPNFIDYALEVHHAGGFDDWYWVPGNSRLTERAADSFAAYTEIPLTAAATRVEFVRYRLDASSPRAATLSFLNTTKVILTGVGLVAKIDVIEKALKRFPVKKDSVALSRCVASLIAAARPPAPTTTRLGQARLMIRFVVEYSKAVLEQFTSCEPLQAQVPLSRRAAFDLLVTKVVAQVALKFAGGPWSWIFIIGDALDSVVPPFLSYVLPQAGSVEYQLAWAQRQTTQPGDCEASLVGVSREGLPMEDSRGDPRCYALRNLRVTDIEQDAVTLEWDPVLGAASYTVTITGASGDPVTLPVRAPIAVVTPVVIGATYKFSVVGVSDAGDAGRSAALTYRHNPVPAPRALRVTHTTAAYIQMAWDAQGSEGGYGYRVEVIDGYGAGHTVGYIMVDAQMYTAEGLEQGKEYCFLVTHVNDHKEDVGIAGKVCGATIGVDAPRVCKYRIDPTTKDSFVPCENEPWCVRPAAIRGMTYEDCWERARGPGWRDYLNGPELLGLWATKCEPDRELQGVCALAFHTDVQGNYGQSETRSLGVGPKRGLGRGQYRRGHETCAEVDEWAAPSDYPDPRRGWSYNVSFYREYGPIEGGCGADGEG